MGRKKSAAPKHETAAQKALESTKPLGGGQEGHGVVSKAQAVRNALARGKDSPGDIVDFLQSEYGLEMNKQTASSYKTQQKARDAKQSGAPKGKPGRKPRSAIEGYLAPPPKQRANGDLLETLEALKPLIAEHGADRLKRLVDLLG